MIQDHGLLHEAIASKHMSMVASTNREAYKISHVGHSGGALSQFPKSALDDIHCQEKLLKSTEEPTPAHTCMHLIRTKTPSTRQFRASAMHTGPTSPSSPVNLPPVFASIPPKAARRGLALHPPSQALKQDGRGR